MESAALATENLKNTMATLDAMQVANKELKKQYGKVDIDKIDVGLAIHFSVHPIERTSDLGHAYGNGRPFGTG